MLIFALMLGGWLAVDLLWWRWADRRLRPWRWQRVGRVLLAAFMCVQVAYLVKGLVLLGLDLMGVEPPPFNVLAWDVLVYMWHVLVVLPFAGLTFVGHWAGRLACRRGAAPPAQSAPPAGDVPAPLALSRRSTLAAAMAVIPPVFTGVGGVAAVRALTGFRVRRVDVRLPALPADLDGVTIAHLSDLHIGQFLPGGMERRVAEATNALGADLVAFTGDLMDISGRSVKLGVDFLRQLDPRHGLAIIEGNHDGMGRKAAGEFEDVLKTAGMPLLLDEAKTVRIPGRRTAIQFLGQSWGRLRLGRDIGRVGKEANYYHRARSDEATAESFARLSALRDSAAFPILLAHHPHSFDPAVAAGVPLTLSGHTHGGQLMLTDRIGVGPARFRYWSGMYEKGDARLFVSNGIGSWFPLRVNAPAEIILLTLRRAGA